MGGPRPPRSPDIIARTPLFPDSKPRQFLLVTHVLRQQRIETGLAIEPAPFPSCQSVPYQVTERPLLRLPGLDDARPVLYNYAFQENESSFLQPGTVLALGIGPPIVVQVEEVEVEIDGKGRP